MFFGIDFLLIVLTIFVLALVIKGILSISKGLRIHTPDRVVVGVSYLAMAALVGYVCYVRWAFDLLRSPGINLY